MIRIRTALRYLTLCAVLVASQVAALDVKIRSTLDNEDLNADLEAASLLVALQTGEPKNSQDVLAAAKADYQRLVTALYRYGHYAPVVTIQLDGREAAGISPINPPASIRAATISVRPGPAFRFGRATIAPVALDTELPEDFRPGAIARVDILRDTAAAGIDGWRAKGYAKARVSDQRITARHEQAQLDAQIALDPGPQLRFGRLIITGNEDVRTRRVEKIAGLPTGKVFSPEEIDRATTRLRRTGTFRVVALTEAEEIGPNNTIDVTAQVVEAPPRRIGFGAEISSLEGLGLSAFWLHRNLLGGAERFRIEGDVSGIGGQSGGTDYRIGVRIDRPATFNEDTDFFIATELERLDEVNFQSKQFSLEAGIKRYATEKRTYTFGLGFRTADTTDAFGTRSYSILTAPASAVFDYRNDRLSATEGYYAELSLTPFYSLRGTENGLRTYADIRGYKSVGRDDRLTFALRGQLGSVTGPGLNTAPADFLFYSGGGGTVRGQEYQSLGVDLGGGNEVGGRSFLGLSGEIRLKTGDKLSVAGFYDLGYIGPEAFPDGSTGEWHSGAGVGIRYDTGIGPIRLDVGLPVSGPGDNNGFEVYIGIGQAF